MIRRFAIALALTAFIALAPTAIGVIAPSAAADQAPETVVVVEPPEGRSATENRSVLDEPDASVTGFMIGYAGLCSQSPRSWSSNTVDPGIGVQPRMKVDNGPYRAIPPRPRRPGQTGKRMFRQPPASSEGGEDVS